jgi:glutamate-ammonia-ligase adenylyltransferase
MQEKKNFSPTLDQLPSPISVEAEKAWDGFLRACERAGLSPPMEPSVVEAYQKAFAFSDFVGKRAALSPGVLCDLVETGDLSRIYAESSHSKRIHQALDSAGTEEGFFREIRRFRNREMLRIAVRDLAGWAELAETMADLSRLAEACIDYSIRRIYDGMKALFGSPADASGNPLLPVVLGVGKLGGRELNFSSDIDLLFAYAEGGTTRGGGRAISHEEFFSKLFRRLIQVLSRNSPDGFVFRVDTRLRPYGDSGPIAMNFDAFETYYQEQGREWERYALIKARPVAGDIEAGNRLMERLRPFIYRRYLDFGTFEDLREMKQKIVQEVRRKGLYGNIKLGAGGIREIEFFCQVFQLIRGGVNSEYQGIHLMTILSKLYTTKCIPETVYRELRSAYTFLRRTEHRLQMAEDRQTHTLPKEPLQRLRLALSMDWRDRESFEGALSAHMERVHFHFNELLADPQEKTEGAVQTGRLFDELWSNLSDEKKAAAILSDLGFDSPLETRKILQEFLDTPAGPDVSTRGKERIFRLLPQILQKAAETDEPEVVLQRVLELVRSIRSRSCYVALLLENPEALTHLISLSTASPWIISYLSHHPMLLDELLDSRTLYVPLGKSELEEEVHHRLGRVSADDLEQQMDVLRVFKQSHTLRIAAADVAGLLPLMKVSDRLTYLAETIIDTVLELSWKHLVEKYGRPKGAGEDQGIGFVVIAYGKLGGYELGYGSDLDLVFLHAADSGYTEGGRLSAIDNHQFYVRLGQRVIHFLSTMTAAGKLYEADMRLRPSGTSGVLVSHIEAFEEYEQNQAWTWEHQALIKSRPISGDAEVGERFEESRKKLLRRKRDRVGLRREVADMRARMRSARSAQKESGQFDIKNDVGGIIDIEFLVQYLILLHAHTHPPLVQWTDVVRQLNSLALTGVIGDRAAHMLKQAYLVFRYMVHRRSLQRKPATIEADRLTEHRRRVKKVWEKYFQSDPCSPCS